MSVTIAQLLFAAYLVIALILLINMLIALLSNTYQRVQVNEKMTTLYYLTIMLLLTLLLFVSTVKTKMNSFCTH